MSCHVNGRKELVGTNAEEGGWGKATYFFAMTLWLANGFQRPPVCTCGRPCRPVLTDLRLLWVGRRFFLSIFNAGAGVVDVAAAAAAAVRAIVSFLIPQLMSLDSELVLCVCFATDPERSRGATKNHPASIHAAPGGNCATHYGWGEWRRRR